MCCRRVLAVLIIVLSCAGLAAAKDLALVSNKSNTITAITMADLVKVCKGQTNRWPDGKPVTVITRGLSTAIMKIALERVYGMSQAEVAELIAAANHGRQNHPAIVIVDSDEDVVNKVASIPGAVGLVDVYSINSAVAVVKIAGKLPLEPGYPLHGN